MVLEEICLNLIPCSHRLVCFRLTSCCPSFMGFFHQLSQTTRHGTELSTKILLLVTVHPKGKSADATPFFLLFLFLSSSKRAAFQNPLLFAYLSCNWCNMEWEANIRLNSNQHSPWPRCSLTGVRFLTGKEKEENEKVNIFHTNIIFKDWAALA